MAATIAISKNEKTRGTDNIIVTCGDSVERWTNRQEAMNFYMQGAMECSGSEAGRYAQIYVQLADGKNECSDGI